MRTFQDVVSRKLDADKVSQTVGTSTVNVPSENAVREELDLKTTNSIDLTNPASVNTLDIAPPKQALVDSDAQNGYYFGINDHFIDSTIKSINYLRVGSIATGVAIANFKVAFVKILGNGLETLIVKEVEFKDVAITTGYFELNLSTVDLSTLYGCYIMVKNTDSYRAFNYDHSVGYESFLINDDNTLSTLKLYFDFTLNVEKILLQNQRFYFFIRVFVGKKV